MNKDVPAISSLTLVQKSDCCDIGDNYQYLTIEVQDGGGGAFVTLSSERWAMDSDSFNCLEKFCKKLIRLHDKADLLS